MKRSNAADHSGTVLAAGLTTSTKSYQLRGPAKRSKRSTSANQNSVVVLGTKKSSSTNDKGATTAVGHNSSQQVPRRSSLRLGLRSRSSSSSSSNVINQGGGGGGGQNTRTKRTTSNDNSSQSPPQIPQLPSQSSSLSSQSSSPPPLLPSSIAKSKKVIKSENSKTSQNEDGATVAVAADSVTDNNCSDRKVRVPKTQSISRSKKITGVGKSNEINDHNNSHNNNDHGNDNDNDNNVVVVNSVGQNQSENRNFDTASSLDDDDKALISKKSSSTTKSKQSNKQTNRVRTKRRYICTYCNKEFLGGNDLRKHVRIHTDERPFECQHCGQRFRQGGCLKNHIASQHGTSETFTCYYCNKSFPIKERLRLHMRLHSGEKPYQCKICFKRFARGGQLTQHLASHTGIKKYRCTQCPNSFSCSVNLKLHVKSHMNVRDYTCHLCGKSFVRPDALKKHLTCFHENVKAFFCNICSRTFKGHLPQHMRVHQNIKSHGCANCGATFSQKSQLIVHQRIHSGERPYRCQVCWQAFAHSSVLKLHIRKHTGEKPFRCSVCQNGETAFSQLPHLKTHMRAIHGMDKVYHCDYCSEYFKTKHELQEHKIKCPKAPKTAEHQSADGNANGEQFANHQSMLEPKCSTKETTLSRMRLLIAVLLKKISSQDRLKLLGFDKRLIDNVLMDALKMAGQDVCTDTNLHEVERLRANINIFLDWSIPDAYMKKLKNEQRSTEELLEDLTSTFNREPKKD